MILCPWSRDEAKGVTAKSFKNLGRSKVVPQRPICHREGPLRLKVYEKDGNNIKVQRGSWIPQNVRN